MTVPTAASVSAPVICSVVANSDNSVTVTGTATGNAAITVWNTVGSEYGTATASSTGAWSYTTGAMLPGVYGFEATATTSAGTSGNSNAIGITLSAAQFPQMENPSLAPKDWRPRFFDYLFTSFANGTSFAPADAMPLTAKAKTLFATESIVSLVTIAVVAARAVNILR